jgi:hypothetical protein
MMCVSEAVACFVQYRAVAVMPCCTLGCSKIAEAEAAVSVNEKKWLVMHMHVQLDELRGPPNPWLTVI